MKFLYIVILLFVLSIVWNKVSGQITSSSRPEIYPAMVAHFKSLPSTENDVIFVGNSITFWGNWQEMIGSQYIRNRGIPGDNIYGILARINDIIASTPKKIFIMMGINDLGGQLTDSVIISNWETLIKQIVAGTPCTKIYVQSILPTNPSFKRLEHLYGHEEGIIKINKALSELAYGYPQCTYVHLYDAFLDEKGFLKEEYTWDGVHLTTAGYQKWKGILYDLGIFKSGH